MSRNHGANTAAQRRTLLWQEARLASSNGRLNFRRGDVYIQEAQKFLKGKRSSRQFIPLLKWGLTWKREPIPAVRSKSGKESNEGTEMTRVCVCTLPLEEKSFWMSPLNTAFHMSHHQIKGWRKTRVNFWEVRTMKPNIRWPGASPTLFM